MLLFFSTILYFLLLLMADCSSKAVQRCRLAGAGVNCRNLVTRETENEKMHFSFSLFSILDPGFHLQLDWILHITAYLHYTVQGAQYTVQVRPSLLFLTTFPPCRLCAHVRVSHSWALFSSCVSCQARSKEQKLLSEPEHLSDGQRSSDTGRPSRWDMVTVMRVCRDVTTKYPSSAISRD